MRKLAAKWPSTSCYATFNLVATLYGISNCDTVRKARKWLVDHHVEFDFHDFRKDGLDRATLEHWCQKTDWETLLNKRSTSWRGIADERKTDLCESSAIDLMLEQPTLIKRPVLERNDQISVGFSNQQYAQLIDP